MRRIGIVNRGECAVRFLQSLDALRREQPEAPEAVALYTDGDAESLYVLSCDHKERIGEGRTAYLDSEAVVAALKRGRCDGAWLGWGFASEDAEFTADLEAAGITLLSPRPDTMEALGDKIRAKQLAEEAGVPVAPWAIVDQPEAALVEAERIGFPLLVKAAGGGGGRGIRRVDRLEDVLSSVESARDEAKRSFRSHGVMLEKLVTKARHVEVQVLGDGEGEVRVVGVRDCSLQRRRQKVIEECPAPQLPPTIMAQLLESAASLTEMVRYRSAGTVEFLYAPADQAIYFLEVNTRLQVEHPVTEEVHGIDLVRAQIELARGRPLPEAPVARGWAFEARVCAEDVQNGFAPAPGRLVRFVLPTGPGVRVDTGFAEGDTISPDFDPLIAKVIAWGPSRSAAIARLSRALEQTRVVVEGGETNLAFLRRLLERPDVKAGVVDTDLVDRIVFGPPAGAGAAMLTAAVDRFEANEEGDDHDRHRVDVGEPLEVYRVGPESYRVAGLGGSVGFHLHPDGPYQMWLRVHGVRHRVERAKGDTRYVVDGVPHRVAADAAGSVTAPSAALVLDVLVGVGATVEAGQTVAVVESMKMEVSVAAPVSGRVREVRAHQGDQVKANQILLVVEAPEDPADSLPETSNAIPWAKLAPDPAKAAERLTQAIIGWDLEPHQFARDLERLNPAHCGRLLETFCDIAQLFERRPTRDALNGAADAVAPKLSFSTLRQRGPDALPQDRRAVLERALLHHGVETLEASPQLEQGLRRLERAGKQLDRTAKAAVAAVAMLQDVPSSLLDRLGSLDSVRFDALQDVADQARYDLIERPEYAEMIAGEADSLLETLRSGAVDWEGIAQMPVWVLTRLAPAAAAGDERAAEAIARLLAWNPDRPFQKVSLNGRLAWRVGRRGAVVLCVATEAEAKAALQALRTAGNVSRADLVITGEGEDAADMLDALVIRLNLKRASWTELCLIGVAGEDGPRCRRFDRNGKERLERRDILPVSEERFDLDRLRHFAVRPLHSERDVFLMHAQAHDNRDDVRMLAYGEVHDLTRAPGETFRLPHLERVLRQCIRGIQSARAEIDPRRRLHWNRLTLNLIPIVDHPWEEVQRYAERLGRMAARVGLEKVVVRARLQQPDELMDLSIRDLSGHRVELDLRPASYRPLMPRTRYESGVVTARRRGLVHPYELVSMLEGGDLGPGRFEEYDLDSVNRVRRVGGRPRGQNEASVVFGIIHTRLPELPGETSRVLVLSDPTRRFGALAEAECRRVLAAFDLAEKQGLPIEWVSVSAGARIDWETGTENLDWTARVLRKIVEFTQAGGEVNVVVPGVCVGAQSYWNAEATMMMHTRGLLIMTERGSMVLTGKRALDFSGCVSAEDELALGGFTSIMGPNGQAQAYAPDLGAAYRLLYRYYAATYVPSEGRRPPIVPTSDAVDRDIGLTPYPSELDHGFETIGQIFSAEHNPDRKRPFAIRPVMNALTDQDNRPVERWAAMKGAETAVVWESRIGGHACTLIGIENRPMARLGEKPADGPEQFAGGTLYPQASRKVARALNAASGRRPVVVLANLSGFDGSPESLAHWQLEYGAEIGRAVVNFDGPVVFAVISRYHGGAYVVFSKALNPQLRSVALVGSYASVIGGAPAAAVVFARDVAKRARELGGGPDAKAKATAELAARFDGIHTVERARDVGSIDALLEPGDLRRYIVEVLHEDHAKVPKPRRRTTSRPRKRNAETDTL